MLLLLVVRQGYERHKRLRTADTGTRCKDQVQTCTIVMATKLPAPLPNVACILQVSMCTAAHGTKYLYRHLSKKSWGTLAIEERCGVLRRGSEQKNSAGVACGLQASTGGVCKQNRVAGRLLMRCQLAYHAPCLQQKNAHASHLKQLGRRNMHCPCESAPMQSQQKLAVQTSTAHFMQTDKNLGCIVDTDLSRTACSLLT